WSTRPNEDPPQPGGRGVARGPLGDDRRPLPPAALVAARGARGAGARRWLHTAAAHRQGAGDPRRLPRGAVAPARAAQLAPGGGGYAVRGDPRVVGDRGPARAGGRVGNARDARAGPEAARAGEVRRLHGAARGAPVARQRAGRPGGAGWVGGGSAGGVGGGGGGGGGAGARVGRGARGGGGGVRRGGVGVWEGPRPPFPAAAIRLPAAVEFDIPGVELRTDHQARLLRAGGKSYP